MADQDGTPDITPERIYLNRRNFLRTGLLAGTAATTALVYRSFRPGSVTAPASEPARILTDPATGDPATSFEEIANYNNFYEFSTNKTDVAAKAQALRTRPWAVEIGGMVAAPQTLTIEEILDWPQEERVYRFRCVEGWSMVIPWTGFQLSELLARVQPLEKARYVAFETAYDPATMQSELSAGIAFPYVEGLRLDEAMHPLTILATGLYGKPMPNQNGAPLRLVVPWKYGFKSIKSIVRIYLTDTEPPATWSITSPREYGFYSNVNPSVDHPRWSQKTERRIGEYRMRETLMFNGYGDEVASLYEGMDLTKFY
ncbi:MAG: protein-methionine-sulfoxide reductase catalytic subunit MsrP [Blastocatellia bacterium]|nr:protein-methionine-sulfoxide reductase catalytic subunit MsrP [Blastocatellia bacterium]